MRSSVELLKKELEKGFVVQSLNLIPGLSAIVSTAAEQGCAEDTGRGFVIKNRACFAMMLSAIGLNPLHLVDVIEWREFEEFVAGVLSANNMNVYRNIRIRGRGKHYEVDVLAISNRVGLVVECKSWKKVRHSLSAIRSVAAKHRNRVEVLAKRCYSLIHQFREINRPNCFVPIIVLLKDVGIPVVDGVAVVSISKLNDLVTNLDYYISELGIECIENLCKNRKTTLL